MLRMILVVLGWPLLVLVIVSAVLWYREQYPEPPQDQLLTPSQVRVAMRSAQRALEELWALPPQEQERVLAGLRRSQLSPAQWLAELEAKDYPIVCLGEHHEPATRRFLADVFFSHYRLDVLLLEATPAELERIERWTDDGRDYVPLLDADISAVLAAVRRHSPGAVVRGIEETPAQIRARAGREGSRDRSLVRNFWQAWQPGRRNVILYGALHCTTDPTWLFHHLREQLPPREDVPLRNVRVVGTAQHQPTRAFVFFLEALGMARDDFVIADTDAVPDTVRRWFPSFDQQILRRFSTLLVFHNEPVEFERLVDEGRQRAAARAPGSKDSLPQWVPADQGP